MLSYCWFNAAFHVNSKHLANKLPGILDIKPQSYKDAAVPGGHKVHFRSSEAREPVCSAEGVSQMRLKCDRQLSIKENVPRGHKGL